MKKTTTAFIVIVLVIIIGVIIWISTARPPAAPEPVPPDTETRNEPIVFSSEEFGVTLEHPATWNVSSESLFDITRALNIYKPGSDTPPPYTHHNDVTNVSFFPNGIPTEGLFAPSEPFAFDLGFETSHAIQFVLEDGTPFAAYIRPISRPASWDEAGFIWIRAQLTNASTACTDFKGEVVPEERCDPLTEGHQIIWTGDRDDEGWEEALEILSSLELGS